MLVLQGGITAHGLKRASTFTVESNHMWVLLVPRTGGGGGG